MLRTKMMGVGEAEVGAGLRMGFGEWDGAQKVSMENTALPRRLSVHSQEKGM